MVKNSRAIIVVTLMSFSTASIAQSSGGFANSIADGVNGFSNFLNGTSAPRSSVTSSYLGGNTATPGYLPNQAPVNLSAVLQESTADCDDIKLRMQKRMDEANQAITPDSNPGEATEQMGVDAVLNMPIGINLPAEVLTEIGKKTLLQIATRKAESFFSNQLQKLQNTIRSLSTKVTQLTSGF